MPNRPFPIDDDEQQRIETLYQLAILDTPPEERFDQLVSTGCSPIRHADGRAHPHRP